MSGMEIAAIIGAVTTLVLGLLGLLGAAIKYVVQLILDHYKQQVESTESAKNGEIAALEERIDRHMTEIDYLRNQVLARMDGPQ